MDPAGITREFDLIFPRGVGTGPDGLAAFWNCTDDHILLGTVTRTLPSES